MKVKSCFLNFFLCVAIFSISALSFSEEEAHFCDSSEYKRLTLCEDFLKDKAEVFEEAIFSDEALKQIEERVQAEVDSGKGYHNRYYLYKLLIIRGKIMKNFLGTDSEICERYGPFYNKSTSKIEISYNIENATEEGVINVLVTDVDLGFLNFKKVNLYCKDEYDKGVEYYKNGDLEMAQKHLKQALVNLTGEECKKKVFYYLHRIYYEKACQWDWELCKLEKEKNDAEKNCLPPEEEIIEETIVTEEETPEEPVITEEEIVEETPEEIIVTEEENLEDPVPPNEEEIVEEGEEITEQVPPEETEVIEETVIEEAVEEVPELSPEEIFNQKFEALMSGESDDVYFIIEICNDKEKYDWLIKKTHTDEDFIKMYSILATFSECTNLRYVLLNSF